MQLPRKRERIKVDIAVTLTTVLESMEATLVDLTEHGAQVTGASLPEGTRFQIDYQGHSVFAMVQWSEIDRMGVRFPFEMRDGPLHAALEQAKAMNAMPVPLRGVPAPRFGFGRRMG